ncbi:DUF2313 domain-containing protein [Paenibacillus hemerocallicola]|uniref:DUF2313 domain-containing protein n=1 Tax=Paenibacillus hemerocallicola TaxID=1172614 RepID=A0A5C4THU5_9BACL|nr:putative phage tail protein [Paenibacillus hemerocallicola]TNJ68236.1 DUF2313 domain-containing protein [Paenibacillus hemerocallicola]
MPKPILSYLPDYYQDIRDFEELAETEDAELLLLATAVNQLLDDQFVLTSGAAAVKRREQMLEIQAEPSETLEFRKRRILNRYQTKPPFTIRYLQQQLDLLVGPGMTIVSVDSQNFLLTVTANIENASVFREVVYTVELIKPANMVYQQNTSLGSTIGLEESISKRGITWNYALGSWQLGQLPFSTLGPEEVIK